MSVFHNNVLSGAAGQAGGAAAAGPIKSVRFNRSDSASLSRTFAAGNRKTFTLSWWMKSCSYTNNARIFAKGLSTQQFSIMHSGVSDDRRRFYCYFNLDSPTDVSTLTFTGEHRDFSSWAHYVLAFDTTQATDSDRIKFYYNGVQQTDFIGTPNWPTQNASFKWNNSGDTYYIGGISTYHIDAYLADMYHVDGQQLDCTSFGAFDDNGVWQAAAYSGTFGTNGFHLFDFANESGVGNDSSGNDNDWTVNNITNVEANNTEGIDNVSNITQIQNNGTNVDVNLANLQTMMNTSTFQDADTDNSTYGVRVAGTSKKFAVKWSGLTGLTGVSVRWQRASTYDPDVETSGTGITTTTTTLTSGRRQDTFATTSTTGQIVFEDVTTGDTNGFFIRAIEFKGYGSVTYPTNVENFVLSAGADQDVLFDVPTNGDSSDDTGAGGEVSGNYCTFNPLALPSGQTLSNGNLENASTTAGNVIGTIFVNSGKWYWEIMGNGYTSITGKDGVGYTGSTSFAASNSIGYWYTGLLYSGVGTSISGGESYDENDVIGVAIDFEGNNVKWFKNNVEQYSIALNESGFEDLRGGIFPSVNGGNTNAKTWSANFGQRPFVYPQSGYKALCTTNLPDPTIADGSDYFDIALRTADTTQSKSVTGLAFSPDLVWEKVRSHTSSHYLADSVRGSTKTLTSNSTNAEATFANFITSFNSDGYTIGTGDFATDRTVVGWAWDAGTSTVSNTDGSITSSVRANQTAGFSIVTYTGNGTSGATVGHGLNAAPDFVITKNLTNANYWAVYPSVLNGEHLRLNLTMGSEDEGNYWSSFSSSVMTLPGSGTSLNNVNNNGDDYVSFCWNAVADYSAFGLYTGNGNADGPFVYTGFRPAFLIRKRTDGSGGWYIIDTTRDTYNEADSFLDASDSDAEATSTNVDILSNGFKLRNSDAGTNASGGTYLYIAFAENSFSSNGGLAR